MSPGRPYRVLYSGATRDRLRLLVRMATTLGIQDRVGTALRAIEQQLSTDPRGWGDPVRRLPAAHLTVYRRVFDELAVLYAVHDREPYVWLTQVEPVLRHPLSGV